MSKTATSAFLRMTPKMNQLCYFSQSKDIERAGTIHTESKYCEIKLGFHRRRNPSVRQFILKRNC